MKKQFIIIFLILYAMSIILPCSFMTVKADSEMPVTESCEPEQSWFHFYFSETEKTGMIQSFAVSDTGKIATYIFPDINIYDKYGNLNFTIYTTISRTTPVLQWYDDKLFICLKFASGSDCQLVRINGYEDYEIYNCPANADTEKFWNELEVHKKEIITDTGRYYIQTGNLRFEDKITGADYAVTENTSFQSYWLISIPILTAVIWFGFARKRVKTWEEKQKSG